MTGIIIKKEIKTQRENRVMIPEDSHVRNQGERGLRMKLTPLTPCY